MENIILLMVLCISVITDLKSRRIYNFVTLPAIMSGLILYFYDSGVQGFLFSGKGFIVGFGLLLIPFLMGGIGAGDVKLLAATGALKGSVFVLNTFLYGAVIGGMIAIVAMARRKTIGNFFKRAFYSIVLIKATNGSMSVSKEDNLAPALPYGVAIALGAACTYFLGGLL